MTQLILEDQHGETTMVNMGPQHPSTHGVINLRLLLQGEVIAKIDPIVGFLHRSIEKLGEMTPYPGFLPYTDRVDYLSAMFGNQVYCMAVEELLGVEVPRRAEYLRVIACELNRIISHLIAVGTMAMDLGAFTPFLHAIRERETVNDFMERICGARINYSYMRIGGVPRDLEPGLDKDILKFLDRFEKFIPEFNRLITGNEIFVRRLIDLAVIPAADAISCGLSGPNLRSSGVDYDLRRDRPYSAYPEFEFRVVTGEGYRGQTGDCYARYWVRIDEMLESAKIVRQALLGLPEGDVKAKVPRKITPPKGEVYSAVESSRGEMGCYLVSDGGEQPLRVRFRTGSFTAMTVLPKIVPGLMVADLTAFFGSLDVVAPEIDR
ncbi:MAG: NADH-quinone oxidoreductase subunit D [Acidobacteria bacterium]|nr:NADH-quinone oxidoreductase subunit D [Acidobacteriota bacterium]